MNELRPEAAPAAWSELDREQRRVFRKIVNVLADAVNLLPERNRDPNRAYKIWSSHEKLKMN